jgi:hypothetical protein
MFTKKSNKRSHVRHVTIATIAANTASSFLIAVLDPFAAIAYKEDKQ